MRARPVQLVSRGVALAGTAVLLASLAAVSSAADKPNTPRGQDRLRSQPPPIRTTMKELHAHGGVPPRWKFLIPPGDATEGRNVFVSMECYACHGVNGENFPQDSKTPRGSGPDLTGMGGHHPAEYFVESILNPNRVIVQGPGYTGPDGLSKMPSYAETMTLKQLVDVVAYLKSLGGGMTSGHHGTSGSMKMDDSMKTK